MSSKPEPSKPEQSKPKTVWPCSLCPEKFRWRRHLDKHIEGHRNNACRLCDAQITTQKELSLHMLQEHQVSMRNDKHPCEHCERRFPRRRALFSHYQSSHANGKIVCLDCGTFLNSESELELHAVTHAKDRPWKCQRCNASFSRRQQFTLHVEAHDRYCCDVCGRNFATKLAMTEHGRDFHGDSTATHLCPKCDARFERPCQLRRHQESHKGSASCAQKGGDCCGRSFSSARSLNKHRASVRHLEFVTPDSRKKYECSKCGQRFARKSSIARHVAPRRVHTCPSCPFTSRSAGSARRHRLLHSAPRTFVCDRCAAAFHSLAALNEHTAYRHSESREFACISCNLGFKTKSALTRHAQAHSDSRPHACACGQKYKRASHLRRHQTAAHGPTASKSASRKVARTSETDQSGLEASTNHAAASAVTTTTDSLAANEATTCWTSSGIVDLGSQQLQPDGALQVHQQIVSLSDPRTDPSHADIGICQTMLHQTMPPHPDINAPHQSIGASYKNMVQQTVGELHHNMGHREIHVPVNTMQQHGHNTEMHAPVKTMLQHRHNTEMHAPVKTILQHGHNTEMHAPVKTMLQHRHNTEMHAPVKTMLQHGQNMEMHVPVKTMQQHGNNLNTHAPVKTMPSHGRDMEMSHVSLQPNAMQESHHGMVDQAMELAHQDLLQQAMEMAHRDMVRQGLEVPRQGLGTPEQMLQDGYDFGATGLEFTTLQTVHKARDLTQLTVEDMAFSADSFLL